MLLGRVHALACQVGGRAWRQGAGEVCRIGGIDLGLHLDLTEHPLTRAALPLGRLIGASLLRLLDAAALQVEIAAQIDRFEDAIGRPPDFVDGHQHVHQLPQVREALLAVLARRGPHRPWLRNTRRRLPLPGTGSAQFKPWLIERLGADRLAALARHGGFEQNRALLGVYDFLPSTLGYGVLLRAWLDAAADGDLLMCHAGQRLAAGDDAILEARVAEFEVLRGAELDELLHERRIVLAPLSLTRGFRGPRFFSWT